MEERIREAGQEMSELDLSALDVYWEEAKKRE
jgi:hypothetical protein